MGVQSRSKDIVVRLADRLGVSSSDDGLYPIRHLQIVSVGRLPCKIKLRQHRETSESGRNCAWQEAGTSRRRILWSMLVLLP
jgi:hypothetical protein